MPALLVALTLAVVSTASAEGIQIQSGQWKVTTTIENSMMPQPQVKTSTECVKQESWDPTKEMMKDNSGCKVTDQKVEGNTLRWKLECPNKMGKMTGSGEFTVDGDSATGSMDMSMTLQGQPMTFKSTWKGTRVGECS